MSRSLAIVLVLASILALAASKGYDGYKIYEITPQSLEECEHLHKLSKNEDLYDFFTISRRPHQPSRVMVKPEDQSFHEFLQQHHLKYSVINEDVGKSSDHEIQVNRLLRRLSPITGKGRLSTDRYYSHGEINNYIEDLAQRFPSRAFIKTVGKSYEGRIMKTITITNGDGRSGKNVIFMDGAFHAREWISPAAVIYAIEQLVENFSENTELLLDYDWVVLPVVNPDGYEYTQLDAQTRLWRKTRKPLWYLGEICYGTDPNRNFDFHWNEEGASSIPCSNTFAGPKAFSEPEAVVVRDIMHTLRGRGVMYLTVHSQGNLILYPWGWSSDLPDTWEDLHEVAKAGKDAIFEATGTVYTIGSSTNVLYVAAGASDDYAFNDGFPISFTMELPGGGPNGFDPPVELIDEFVKETWIGIRAMAKRVTEKYPLKRF